MWNELAGKAERKFSVLSWKSVRECEMRNVEFEMKDWETHTNSTFLIPH